MPRFKKGLCLTSIFVACVVAEPMLQTTVSQQKLVLTATTPSTLRQIDTLVDRMVRNGELRLIAVASDTILPDHQHERLAQYHDGVQVFGADVTRQTASGLTTSIFGQVYPNIDVGTIPTLSLENVRETLTLDHGFSDYLDSTPDLMILKTATGTFNLVHKLIASTSQGPRVLFVDANTGVTMWNYSAIQPNNEGLPCDTCAVGEGFGVKGDTKKISVRAMGGAFRTVDLLRPTRITTYDLDGDWVRLLWILNNQTLFHESDIGRNTNNSWTDGAVVDAHVGAGWTYDYFYNRFGRRGLDGKDGPIVSVVHPVHRRDLSKVPSNIVSLFYLNAFYCGSCGAHGIVVYGEGLPPDANRPMIDFFSGALDVVSHELTHAVTANTSQLIYRNESGALNEAFSDIVGVSIEFFMAESGRHKAEQADYILGEDVFKAGGIRSLASPSSFGDPDHYSIRFLGSRDNGGVHTNSTIAGHAFYLAIEGGTNSTSGLSVTGVGSQNRALIERAFYRAFTMLMPADATFSIARSTTVQSARDMFGPDHMVERAIADAWTAVGVE